MNFIEKNRTVEPHSESILFLYLQDAAGNPVANKQVKIWAGPPPSGEPPYFTDDDPNHPNRRTDASGKFQFTVVNGAPPNRLDYFVQPLGGDNTPESKPVQFPFPPGQAQWVIVTLGAEPQGARDGSPTPSDVTAAPAMSPAPAPAPAAAQPPLSSLPQLTGGVRGRIGNTQAGARLVLKSRGRTLDALVASDGLYSFVNVPVGVYTLELSGTGVINPALNVSPNQTTTFDYPAVTPAPGKKVLKHYLLFGPGAQPGTMTNLILALDYIVHFAPTVGFSVDEAMSAERVTIVGGASAVSTQDELRLKDSGSKVARLQAIDSYALENLFQQLLASGSPFL